MSSVRPTDPYFIDLTDKATYIPDAVIGDTFIVKFNDVAYECTAWSDGTEFMKYIGNGRILGSWARYDSGVPFVVIVYNDGTEGNISVYCDTKGYASIEILKVN